MPKEPKRLTKKHCRLDEGDFNELPRRGKGLARAETLANERRVVKNGKNNARSEYMKRRADFITPAGQRVSSCAPLIVRHINRRVRENFKLACMKNGTTMNAAIADFVRWFGNTAVDNPAQKVDREDTHFGRPMAHGSFRRAYKPALPKKFMKESTSVEE